MAFGIGVIIVRIRYNNECSTSILKSTEWFVGLGFLKIGLLSESYNLKFNESRTRLILLLIVLVFFFF